MKKLLFALLCLTPSACLVSLSSFSQVRMGLQLGYNNSDFRQREDLLISDYGGHFSALKTFQAGVLAEIRLGKHWFLDPALLYHGNGAGLSTPELATVNLMESGPYDNMSLKIFYLKLPVNLLYKIKLGKNLDAFAGAGLYIARGIYGWEKGTIWVYNSNIITGIPGIPIQAQASVDQKVHFSNGATTNDPLPSVKPFDFGYDLTAGIEWSHLRLTPCWSEGLTHAINDDGYQAWNRTFSVSLAYMVKL